MCAVGRIVSAVVATTPRPSISAWGAGGLWVGGGIAGAWAWLLEAEDVDGIRCGRDAEKRAGHVERHAINGARISAATKLVEFLAPGHGENPDDGARLACRGQQGAIVVKRDARQR